MSKKKSREGNRAFLNRPGFHEDASLSWNISIDGNGWCYGSINIRDCSDSISLELNVHSEEWYENSKFKIETMIKLLQESKCALVKYRKEYVRIKKEKGE